MGIYIQEVVHYIDFFVNLSFWAILAIFLACLIDDITNQKSINVRMYKCFFVTILILLLGVILIPSHVAMKALLGG